MSDYNPISEEGAKKLGKIMEKEEKRKREEKNKEYAKKIGEMLDKVINNPEWVKKKLHEHLEKEEKMRLTNQYLKDKDFGEKE